MIIALDYLKQEKVTLQMNAYAITIAAFIHPGNVPIIARQAAVKMCILLFTIQSAMAFYFIYEVLDMNNF